MYCPAHFEETRPALLHGLMAQYPLAVLVTLHGGVPEANHIPLLLHADGPQPVLRGHVARANPLWQQHAADVPVLAVFQGPQAYIAPAWYASKKEHGKVVPTWNYLAVHARGPLRVVHDADWLHAHLTQLTHQHEQHMPEPWQLEDAPADYTAKLMQAIVGIEITITDLQGKWKASQNRPEADRAGVVQGLQAQGHADMAAHIPK